MGETGGTFVVVVVVVVVAAAAAAACGSISQQFCFRAFSAERDVFLFGGVSGQQILNNEFFDFCCNQWCRHELAFRVHEHLFYESVGGLVAKVDFYCLKNTL